MGKQEWVTYQPTFTRSGAKNVKLPDGRINGYYWSKWRIITTIYEYKQTGKTVEMRTRFRRLTFWQSLKFIIRAKLKESEK